MIATSTAAGLAKVEVDPSSVTGIYPGAIIPVEVKIRDVVGLSAWEVKLSVDPLVLKPLPPVLEGDFLSSVGSTYFKVYFSLLGDYVQAGCMLLEPVTASGDGTLMTMNFEVIGAGSSKIACDVKLLDLYLNEIPHTSSDSQVSMHSVAEVTGRWEEAQRFVISAEEDEFNTLYANVANSGKVGTVYTRVIFTGYAMDGQMIQLVSPTIELPQGDEAVVSADFDAVEWGEGKYYFDAKAEVAYEEGGVWYAGCKVKTLSFVVLP
jgi:hypothetical protein